MEHKGEYREGTLDKYGVREVSIWVPPKKSRAEHDELIRKLNELIDEYHQKHEHLLEYMDPEEERRLRERVEESRKRAMDATLTYYALEMAKDLMCRNGRGHY